jgi:hypothetical protein
MVRQFPRFHSMFRCLFSAGLLYFLPVAAMADVRVIETGSDTFVVEVHDATVQQVIEALRASRKIDAKAPAELSRVITGTYSGTLLHVLARVLERYDHVIKLTRSGIHLEVVGLASPDTATGLAVNSTMPMTRGSARISGNVDLDEENAAPAPPHATGASNPSEPSARPVAAALNRRSAQPAQPHIVNGKLDLDGEILQ